VELESNHMKNIGCKRARQTLVTAVALAAIAPQVSLGTAYQVPWTVIKRKPMSLPGKELARIKALACGKQKALHIDTFRYLDVDGIPHPANYAEVRCSLPPSVGGLATVHVVDCDSERGTWQCPWSHEWYVVEHEGQLSYLRPEVSSEPAVTALREAMKATAHAPPERPNLLDGQFCAVLRKVQFDHWGVDCGDVKVDLLERCEGDKCKYTVTSVEHDPIDGDLVPEGRYPPHAADWRAPQ